MENVKMVTSQDELISKAKIRLQVAKSNYGACKVNHANEVKELEYYHQKKLRQLEGKLQHQLQPLEQAIAHAEHELRLLTDVEYAIAYKKEQERKLAEEKRKREEKERLGAEERLCQEFISGYILEADKEFLISIFMKLKANQRLEVEQISWLETKGKNYFQKHSNLYKTYHCIEAEYYVAEYKKDGDVWNVINASSHFRKANLAQKAHDLLFNGILYKTQRNKRLRTAFWTTFGGVKRDLGRFHEGIKMAEEAHQLSPNDYRPCTLLGALHFEIREYETGTEWFNIAEELGAPQHNTDAEIKAVFHKADNQGKEKLRAYLSSLDPKRYAWVNLQNKQKK